jgi:hypothetical protein
MNKTLAILTSLLFIYSCTSQNQDISESNDLGNDPIPLIIDSVHSQMHGQGKAYKISSNDSLYFDISSYKFKLKGEHYDFIRENINYTELMAGSFAYSDVIYNDSMEFLIKVKEVEKDRIFTFDHVMDSLNKLGVKKFDLAFKFYLDNGFGEDVIDVFPVEIVD